MGRGLSPHQIDMLHRLAAYTGKQGGGPVHMEASYTNSGGFIDRNDKEARAALNREAASTSRTLRRLRERGLVEKYKHYYEMTKDYGAGWRLTEAGKLTVKTNLARINRYESEGQ